MQFVPLLRGKLVVVALVSMAIVGGATVAFAATPVGQGLVHSISDQAHAHAMPDRDSHGNNLHAHNHLADKSKKNTCPGFPDAQFIQAGLWLRRDRSTADLCAIPGR